MVDIEYLNRKYIFKDKPVVYKLKCGKEINIYPVLVEDWDIFEENYDILTFNKLEIASPEIIQMSYLKFVIKILLKEEQFQSKLLNILELCLHENDIRVGYENNQPILVICQDNIVKFKIYHKDFDDIKKIILYQNINDYDDRYISKDMRDMMDEYFRVKNGNLQPLSLEDKMSFLGNNSGLLKEVILKMTYRDFLSRFNLMIDQIEYQINKTAEMSGNVKFDKPIEHFIYKQKKNKYDQFFTSKEEFENKINNA